MIYRLGSSQRSLRAEGVPSWHTIAAGVGAVPSLQALGYREEEPGRHVTLLCSSQREGSCMAEEDAVDIEHENSNRFEEYEWCGQKRIRATTLLEGGFRGTSS